MSDEQTGLVNALAAENAAIYTYGVVAAYASASRQGAIATAIADHRARRDQLSEMITATGMQPPAALAAYDLPVPVKDPVSAIQAALAAETDACNGYRTLCERAGSMHVRTVGIDGLSASNLRATVWRVALDMHPATVALPGTAPS